MNILLTGACGFAGSTIAAGLLAARENLRIVGLDNLSRRGSELNRARLTSLGVELHHCDIRCSSDLDSLPACDWVIDAAANPSVLAGTTTAASSRQVFEHNLVGTLNILEYCRKHGSGIVLLSTSRVYSIDALTSLQLTVKDDGFVPARKKTVGLTSRGVSESFSTAPPLSLYGTAKLASEYLTIEYSRAFDFPACVNRCGVLAGAGQFGRAEQGIFSFWIHSFRWRKPLRYIGFGGRGYQVRDCLHPLDLIPLLLKQMARAKGATLCNVAGGVGNSMSLRQLTAWCAERFGRRQVGSERNPRVFDVPWLVLDSSRAKSEWRWSVQTPIAAILEEIAVHADANPQWLELTS